MPGSAMAAEGEEPEDYESDPEGSPLPLAMRRREASDDEEGDEGDEGEKLPLRERVDARAGIESDGDEEGGAQVYDESEEEVDDEEVVYEDVEGELGEDGGAGEVEYDEQVNSGSVNVGDVESKAVVGVEFGADGQSDMGDVGNGENQNEEEKKESEPFAVPTAGAFYMHDDRFRDSSGGRHRRPGGKKLWESRDDRAWVHDRFEEMSVQDAHYDEDRGTHRGQLRGRGKKRGSGRGYGRGSKTRGYDENSTQNRGPKTVRGRGPRRYESFLKNNNDPPPTQRKQYGKNSETINATSGRSITNQSNMQAELVAPQKHTFASSLSSASPPFYPSGASTQKIPFVQKRDSQSSGNNKSFSMLMEDNLPSASHSNTLLRGKGVVGTLSQDKKYAEDSAHPVATRPLANMRISNMGQSSYTRVHGRGVSMSGPAPYQPASSTNQMARAPPQMQHAPAASQKLPQNPGQPALRASTQQVNLRMASANQASPSQGPSVASSEAPEVESPPGSAKHKLALVAKGKAGTQGAGRGSFLYNGTQIIATTGGSGDQSFSPALLPVMQFGGQHPGGLGVPTVGMALPGYVAQPQIGFGNSEMTWVPVLAGAAAGALGASPFQYIAVDGGYYGRQSGQAASGGVSKEASSNKPSNNVWKPPQRAELVNDEFGQRQNKPRRYSEMNFGQ